MSDSSTGLKPVIEEPSKLKPYSRPSLSSAALTERDFSWPRMSMNHSSTDLTPRSSMHVRASSRLDTTTSVTTVASRQELTRSLRCVAQGALYPVWRSLLRRAES